MKDPYDMSREEFQEYLENNTTPTKVFRNAKNIYLFMTTLFNSDCNDSVMREWTFEWWQKKTGRQYKEIYYKWLNNN